MDFIKEKYIDLYDKLTQFYNNKERKPLIAEKLLEVISYFSLKINNSTLIPYADNVELLLACDADSICYVKNSNLRRIIAQISDRHKVVEEKFLDSAISRKYQQIILFSPVGKYGEKDRLENLYLNKCLDLLSPNGRLICLLPQSVLTDKRNKSLREKIISSYSLNTVISLKKLLNTISSYFSLVVIDNKRQSENLFMVDNYKSLEIDIINKLKDFSAGYFIDAKEIYDRFDAEFFNPEYKENRGLIQNRNTDKLGDHAIIFHGLLLPAEERKTEGDYLIIKPQYIFENVVHFGNNKKYYCSKEYLHSFKNWEQYFLKKGDIVVSATGKQNWAIFTGEDNVVIANQNIAIIRAKTEQSKELLKGFFSSETGREYFESQLNFLTHCGVYSDFFTKGDFSLLNIRVPNLSCFRSVSLLPIFSEREAISTLAIQFQNSGWDVKEGYNDGKYRYDIALFYNGKLSAIVEVKLYDSNQFKENENILNQFEKIKSNKKVRLYVFVNKRLCEYKNGKLLELPEIPRPDTINKTTNPGFVYSDDLLINASIEETSVSDRFKLDLIIEKLNKYEKLIQSGFEGVNIKLDSILDKLNQLLSDYQALVERELSFVVPNTIEEEHIIHAFSEEFSDRLIQKMASMKSEEIYAEEKRKLTATFENSWNKMDERSKSFLVSAKVIYKDISTHENIIDYSGVCLLVTKALELELSNRFCKKFLRFLKEKYPGKDNYKFYPTCLINQYGGKPIREKDFTFGSIAHLFCYTWNKSIDEYCSEIHITREQYFNNKSKIIEYCKASFFSNKSDKEIISLLFNYAEEIEKIRIEYRNKSAHTNAIRKVDAEECFDLIIDIEKLLKRMLDSFDI